MHTLFEAVCPECGGDIVKCLPPEELTHDAPPPKMDSSDKTYTCIICGRDWDVSELKLIPMVRGGG